MCWAAGTLVGFLPLLGWNTGFKSGYEKCHFTEVMDYNYLVFLYFATIIFPALLIAAFYTHIYRVVVKQVCTFLYFNIISSPFFLQCRFCAFLPWWQSWRLLYYRYKHYIRRVVRYRFTLYFEYFALSCLQLIVEWFILMWLIRRILAGVRILIIQSDDWQWPLYFHTYRAAI